MYSADVSLRGLRILAAGENRRTPNAAMRNFLLQRAAATGPAESAPPTSHGRPTKQRDDERSERRKPRGEKIIFTTSINVVAAQ